MLPGGIAAMLNLTQRLILGCAILAGLTVGLAMAAHKGLAATGQAGLGYALGIAAVAVAIGTVAAVLSPIRALARDTRLLAQGNLDHRTDIAGRDSFGALAAELNRISVRLRDL